MKRFALILAAATAFVSPALAADVVYEEPPAPMAVVDAPSGWTGFYIGVQGGGAFDPNDPDLIAVDTSFPGGVVVGGVDVFGQYASETDSSFLGGAHIGYDFQMNNFVLGGVIDINAIDYAESADVTARDANGYLYQEERSLDYLATARLRAGFLVTPNALAYATGGVAYGDIDYQFNTTDPLGAPYTASVNDDEDNFGYTVGGGMEVKVTDNVSFGAEYLYTNLGSGDSSTTLTGGAFSGPDGTGSTTFRQDEDFDLHTVTAKLSYRFN